MRYDDSAICHRIAKARASAGLSRQELANGLTMTAGLNVTRRDVRRMERRFVPWELLGEIARLTNTTRGWLLYGERVQDEPNAEISLFDHRPRAESKAQETEGGAGRRQLSAAWALTALALSFLVAVIVLRLTGSIVAALAVLVVVNFIAFFRYLQ